MSQIFYNYYENNKSDITYKIPTRSDLIKTKPVFVTDKELEEIKTMTMEQINKLLEYNKF